MKLPENVAIRILDISKNYEIKHIENQSARATKRRFSWLDRQKEGARHLLSREIFWALRNISFDVPSGQVLGIIGRNGAGKSTFLKILSQIIEPTQGSVLIRGRVGSLLEVGTGFHPELTGRENIFLNGTLLGMRRKQITQVFDEIVAFAEVERFIDTPVKRYSSGMYVRLAFAVAAHLQPDVLIIDEVLSVGDAVFQEKCLGRMQKLGDAGRTVIFVSHNMEAVAALCDRAIVFHEGSIYFDGAPQEAANAYYELCSKNATEHLTYRERGGSCPEVISLVETQVRLLDNRSQRPEVEVLISISGTVSQSALRDQNHLRLAIGINHENGTRLATYVASNDDESPFLQSNTFHYQFRIDQPPLQPGKYWVDVSLISRGETIDCLQHCSSFRIPQPTATHYQPPDPGWGPVRLCCTGYNRKH